MDAKKFFTNKSVCTVPWHGFELEPSGVVKNCIISTDDIGDIHKGDIQSILHGEKNINLKQQMLIDSKPSNCSGCHLQEKNRNDLVNISSRKYYLRELIDKNNLKFYDDPKNFSLTHVDLRWNNTCNQACVYCGPNLSSKWATELKKFVRSDKTAREEVKKYIFDNVKNLKNVYLAGGEPLLMKDNLNFLKLLKEENPKCNIRVNTNLSKTDTGIYELLKTFKNVHWILSVEAVEEEYNYIRYHGDWKIFETNLKEIQTLKHKVSFNMLHFILNYKSIFNCITYLQNQGFNDNSFILGPLYTPLYYNCLNLPDKMLNEVLSILIDKKQNASGYLKNSYENLLTYYTTTEWKKNIKSFYYNMGRLDDRRKQESRIIFKKLNQELDAYTLE